MLAMTVSYLSRTLTRPSLLVQSLFKIASSSVHCSAIFCSFSLIVTHDLKRKKSVNKNYKNVFFGILESKKSAEILSIFGQVWLNFGSKRSFLLYTIKIEVLMALSLREFTV